MFKLQVECSKLFVLEINFFMCAIAIGWLLEPPQRQNAVTLFFCSIFPSLFFTWMFPYTKSGIILVTSTMHPDETTSSSHLVWVDIKLRAPLGHWLTWAMIRSVSPFRFYPGFFSRIKHFRQSGIAFQHLVEWMQRPDCQTMVISPLLYSFDVFGSIRWVWYGCRWCCLKYFWNRHFRQLTANGMGPFVPAKVFWKTNFSVNEGHHLALRFFIRH